MKPVVKLALVLLFTAVLIGIGLVLKKQGKGSVKISPSSVALDKQLKPGLNPLAIEVLRSQSYPGSSITIEETLAPESNYYQYIASYMSDGLKIYALLTIPEGSPPAAGWPVIVFNHGYIPPEVYRTTERYVAYVDALARNGYLVFKPDFRGNGNSEGQPEGAYYSAAYTIDDLNAIASIKKFKDANPRKIGLWGHSMGGNIALRDLVIDPEIKAAVIWGGVVGSYSELMNNWQRRVPYRPSPRELNLRNRGRQSLIQQYGTPENNPTFWHSIDPTFYISDIKTPIQLNAGGADEEVPAAFSASLYEKLNSAGKTVEYYVYPEDNHNISGNFDLAMERTISFFDRYLK